MVCAADAGTITEEDIKFIKTLREDIPKLIILNKADKKVGRPKGYYCQIKSTLDIKGIRYIDVILHLQAGLNRLKILN